MAEARAYQCPVCGAFAVAGDRSCRHCSSLLATLRCGRCFELNFPDDLHCRGCGNELGLRLDAESSDQSCPDCKLPLQAFQAGSGQLLACPGCGGQMVSPELLRALLEQREALGGAAPRLSALPRGNPLSDPVRYRPCPACQQLMNRKNFGGVSGIVVDVCSRHGTFFDSGELPRVLAFVRHGGLAKARAMLQQAAPTSARSPAAPSPTSAPEAEKLGHWLDLLSFVVDILRHG